MKVFWWVSGIICFTAVAVVIGFSISWHRTFASWRENDQRLSAQLSANQTTSTTVNPAVEQIVVWDTHDKSAPAHYVNATYGYETSGTACGKLLNVQRGNIEQMEAKKRKPCPDCAKALKVFIYADKIGIILETDKK